MRFAYAKKAPNLCVTFTAISHAFDGLCISVAYLCVGVLLSRASVCSVDNLVSFILKLRFPRKVPLGYAPEMSIAA